MNYFKWQSFQGKIYYYFFVQLFVFLGFYIITTYFMKLNKYVFSGILLAMASCDSGPGTSSTTSTGTTDTTTEPTTGTPTTPATLHNAFSEFSSNVTAYVSGSNFVINTTGLPNHTSPYWSSTHSLYVAPTVTNTTSMAPGNIDNFNGSYSLSVPANPVQTGVTTATGLGAIGIAVSGSVIYNDEEGPNVPIDNALPSLDYTGAHTGPQSYHYHLEPVAFSNDDTNLIGIMADGFFVYGRKCYSTGTYPTDLDASGGHVGVTQHNEDGEYHYHIQNVTYQGYYLIFPGDYQGTPSNIN